jgi:pyruvate dehydrogenase E2 component (dihydrolipoamide acetyltransferase)
MAAGPALFCRARGNGGSVVVLFHGFGGNHAVWRDVEAHLAGRCRTLAYDLPGHGGSLHTGFAGAKAAARAILDDLAVRGLSGVHVVGHSLGGAVAILMAVLDPSRVASLVLLAPGGIGPDIDGAALKRLAQARTPAEIGTALDAMSASGTPTAPATAAALAAIRDTQGQVERLLEIADAIGRDDRQGVFPPAMLAGISCPVDVAWGTRDPVLPYGQTEALPEGFVLTPVSGAGHMLIEEAPGVVVGLIEARVR